MGRRRRRLAVVLAAILTVAAVLVASAALVGSGPRASLPADGGTADTGGSVLPGTPLMAVQTSRSRAALWTSCNDPGRGNCAFAVATTEAGWKPSRVLAFRSDLLPRLVALRSGVVAVLADGPRGWLLASGGEATPLTFPAARMTPLSTVTLTSAPPGTRDEKLDQLTPQDIEAGKDTNADIWAIDEAARTAAIHWSQPGSPASLSAEPVRVGTTTYAPLGYPWRTPELAFSLRFAADEPHDTGTSQSHLRSPQRRTHCRMRQHCDQLTMLLDGGKAATLRRRLCRQRESADCGSQS